MRFLLFGFFYSAAILRFSASTRLATLRGGVGARSLASGTPSCFYQRLFVMVDELCEIESCLLRIRDMLGKLEHVSLGFLSGKSSK
jgi:hypothetical protein